MDFEERKSSWRRKTSFVCLGFPSFWPLEPGVWALGEPEGESMLSCVWLARGCRGRARALRMEDVFPEREAVGLGTPSGEETVFLLWTTGLVDAESEPEEGWRVRVRGEEERAEGGMREEGAFRPDGELDLSVHCLSSRRWSCRSFLQRASAPQSQSPRR